MNPERWRQIEALYHSARERGIAVLEGTDPDLRREVERLLAQESRGKILDRSFGQIFSEISPAVPADLTGQTVSHYQVREVLGAGGMGVVYKAFDARLNRLVALKFLAPRMRHDDAWKRQLTAEARAASSLDHPNIVVVHDIGETPAGDLFIAMAFHQGTSLRQKIAQEPMPVVAALKIARQIAAGLGKAHENGIFHRDIKPGNIIVADDGVARIIDFGLARSLELTMTLEGAAQGTPLYMSPEQARGAALDHRTDLWSLGAVLYEMLAGKPPFQGPTQAAVIGAVLNCEAQPLQEIRADLPPAVIAIVGGSLTKDRARRYQTASAMEKDISAALAEIENPPRSGGLRPKFAIPAAISAVAVAIAGIWYFRVSERRHGARESIPQIESLLNQDKAVKAYRLLQTAVQILPGDPQLAQLADRVSHPVSIHSNPPGATVEIKDYGEPDAPWVTLGVTPLASVRVPSGYLRWRVSKRGAGEMFAAPPLDSAFGFVPELNFALDSQEAAPPGMVAVPATHYQNYIWSLGFFGPYDLPQFYIDRLEVTNGEYQKFVDQGGYRNRAFWKEKFLRDQKELSWDQAMGLFRDSTGRPGPAMWQAGRYPEGQADYPVGGVSWYEASAYAEFAGKSLPVIAQWFFNAPAGVARHVIPLSNFSRAVAPAGKHSGWGAFGTLDMAGNVAEWCLNSAGGGLRYFLGGAYSTITVEYFEPGAVSPFHRGPEAGFRCVRNTAPLPQEALAERRPSVRDLTSAKPVSDSIFDVYRTMYGYDRTPLRAALQSVPQDSRDWRKEKVVFDAAYGNERMAAYLLIPKNVNPPFQTVVFFPSTRVFSKSDSSTLEDMKFADFVVQSGRAVLYPVYKSTYERQAPMPGPDSTSGRETMIQDSKDIGRSLDYLATRSEFDPNRIAYLGVSQGAGLGVNFVAIENRFKAAVLLDGGLFSENPLPGTDQVDFAPRIKVPTLLVAGKYDWIFIDKDKLMHLLGAPDANKKMVLLDTAHDVAERRPELIHEVVSWLDKYLGKVN